MSIKLDEDEGTRVPTALASRIKMAPDVPKAKEVIKAYEAEDLMEMIFGEDA